MSPRRLCCFFSLCTHSCGHVVRAQPCPPRACRGTHCRRPVNALKSWSSLPCTVCLDASLLRAEEQGATPEELQQLDACLEASEDADEWTWELLGTIVIGLVVYSPTAYRNDICSLLRERPEGVQCVGVCPDFVYAYEEAHQHRLPTPQVPTSPFALY